MSSDPNVCLELSPFGPLSSDSVVVPTPHPDGAGYGGSSYGLRAYGDNTLGGVPSVPVGGYGQDGIGYSPYGAGVFPATPFAISGGYGGDPYGFMGFGSKELAAPRVSAAISISGTRIEVFFSEPMDPRNPALTDPKSYNLIDLVGATAEILSVALGNASSVDVGAAIPITEYTEPSTLPPVGSVGPDGGYGGTFDPPPGPGSSPDFGMDDYGAGDMENVKWTAFAEEAKEVRITTDGVTSVILTHTGTTLGGTYKIKVVEEITDIAGNAVIIPTDISEGSSFDVIQSNEAVFFSRGDAPTYTVSPISGDKLLLDFDYAMLKEEEYSPGVESLGSYSFSPVEDYPVPLTVLAAEHLYLSEPDKIVLNVKGMTSIEYGSILTPAVAFAYKGQGLPNESSDFTGVEIGTGTSFASPSLLSLSKDAGDIYGWEFVDSSGRLSPIDSTYRMDVTFNAGNAAVMPVMGETSTLAHFVFADGNTKLSISLDKLSGQDVLSVSGYADLPAAWSSGVHTLSVIRNQRAKVYAILFDGVPLGAIKVENIIEPADFSGLSFYLSAAFKVSNFHIESVSVNATDTLYSSAWNFMHNIEASFMGSAALTKDHLFTQRGPLVKGWGDATPATKQDVEVRVNGQPVDVANVNPYTGKISTMIPIPRMPVGDMSVDVDYRWFPTPKMEMRGLNYEGLTLNKWNLSHGHNDPPSHGEQVQTLLHPKGVPDTARFPMGIVLGPSESHAPLHIGHRYLGFEREYTASLNSPVTLLLNQNPNSVSRDKFEDGVLPVNAYYEGDRDPQLAYYLEDGTSHKDSVHLHDGIFYTGSVHTPFSKILSPWDMAGTGDGSIDPSIGSYILSDTDTEEPYFYHRPLDLSHPSVVRLVARFHTNPVDELNGVFTGVGFGVHNNRTLFFVGTLFVPSHNEGEAPVQHVGLLKDAERPHLQQSWTIGPQIPIEIFDVNRARTPTENLPLDLDVGKRFQIVSGSQEGTYHIKNLIRHSDGSSEITVHPHFPASPGKWETTHFNACLETKHTEILSYVLTTDPLHKKAKLYVSGEVSGCFLDLSEAPSFTEPSLIPLSLDTHNEGQVFWGSVDRSTKNSSTWTFFRYATNPDYLHFRSHGHSVRTEMNALPEDNPNSEWFREQIFGYSEIDSTADGLLLKSTFSSEVEDFSYHYTRIEPYLDRQAAIDLDAKFKVDSGVLGSGDARIEIKDGSRQVTLAALLYMEENTSRSLVSQPVLSLGGVNLPHDKSWEKLGTFSHTMQGKFLSASHTGSGFTGWSGQLDLSNSFDEGGRIVEARFAVESFDIDAEGHTGVSVLAQAGKPGEAKQVWLSLVVDGGTPFVRLRQLSGAPIRDFYLDWTDGGYHTYRLIIDAPKDAITVILDDHVHQPISLTDFPSVSSHDTVMFGHDGGGTTADVYWESLSFQVIPPAESKRTLGVWLGGDPDNINNWELPRIDSSKSPNTAFFGPDIVEMDWRDWVDVRIHKDPAWGVTILRTDMPPPPYFDGQWASDITSPSAGWINVEYRDLPSAKEDFGSISFGAIDPRSVTQQKWESIRYKVYSHFSDDLRSHQGMILNRSHVITSGETTKDLKPEKVTVETLDSTRVSLKSAHIYASHVFRVLDQGSIVPLEHWQFDVESQLITLTTGSFSEPHVPVTVIFTCDLDVPATNTYLQAQPLQDSVTLLNEGTPPYAWGRTKDAIRGITTGAQLSYYYDTLNTDADFSLNDPSKAVTFTDDPESLYDSMEFFQISRGRSVPLSSICDSPSPAHGFREIAIEGSLFQQQHSGIPKPDFEQLGGMPGTILFASGGLQTLGGNLGGGPEFLQGNTTTWPVARGGVDQKTSWNIRLDQVILDSTDMGSNDNFHRHLHEQVLILGADADNMAPSQHALVVREPDGIPDAPDGVLGIHNRGACLATIEQASAHSRLGPWGGISSLVPTDIPGKRHEYHDQQVEVGGEEVGPVFVTGSLLYGSNPSQPEGVPATGHGMVLQGGAPLPDGSAHTFVIQSPDATPTMGGYGGDPYGGETENGVGGGSGGIEF